MPYNVPSSGGTGTVTASGGSLTANSVILGAGTTDSKVVAGVITDGISKLTLGVNVTSLGAVKMFGNTSGDVTIQPNAVAGTGIVLTLPATTDTLVGKTTTDTLTNKTFVAPALGTPASGVARTDAPARALGADSNPIAAHGLVTRTSQLDRRYCPRVLAA